MSALNNRTLEEWVAECIEYRSPKLSDNTPNTWECVCSLSTEDLNDLIGLASLQKCDLEASCFRYLVTSFNATCGPHEVQKVDTMEEVV